MQSSVKKECVTLFENHQLIAEATDSTEKIPVNETIKIFPKVEKIIKSFVSDKKKCARKRVTTKYMSMKQIPLQEEKTDKEVVLKKYVAVTHNINQEMLTYHHWTGKYTPTTFVVSVDGVVLKEGETKEVLLNTQNEIAIRYDYSFLKGYKTGSREIYFSPVDNKNNLLLTFSWHTPGHLILEDFPIVRDVVVPFNKLLEK